MTTSSDHAAGADTLIPGDDDHHDEPASEDVTTESAATAEDAHHPPRRSSMRRARGNWPQIVAALALCGSAALASSLYLGHHRTDQATAAAQSAVVSAASEGSAALLSYAPDTVERDLAAAQSHLTGEFLTYYSDFAEQIVTPAAKDKAVHATATVVRAATADVDGNHAKVLVFLNQSTTSKDNPTPAQTASSVMVGMTDVDGRWLISSFDPL
jgi:Mce-associated membrane protein